MNRPDNEIMNDLRTIANATAVILTGGKSSRMGRPKALLPFDGEPLIAHVVQKSEKQFLPKPSSSPRPSRSCRSCRPCWCATRSLIKGR